MSIREYIGARYVPIFGRKGEDSIQWDNSSSYEPLTVVMYQGASYTSRQFVPAGIPITNAQYWALTGNYNAQVEAYRQEVQTFDGRITENANAISENANAISEETAARTQAISEEATARTQAIDDLEEIVEAKNELIYIGDSWGARNSGVLPNALANFLNCKLHNYAVSSMGFIQGENNFSVQADRAIADTSVKSECVKYIAIVGGSNDFSHGIDNDSTLAVAINSIVNKLKAKFKKAEIHIAFNPRFAFGSNQFSKLNTQIKLYNNVAQQIGYRAINAIPHPESVAWMAKRMFESDLVHLDETRSRYWAQYLAIAMSGGNMVPDRTNVTSESLNAYDGVSGNIYFYFDERSLWAEVYLHVTEEQTSTHGLKTGVGLFPVELFTDPEVAKANNGMAIPMARVDGQGNCNVAIHFTTNEAGNDTVFLSPVKGSDIPIQPGYYFGFAKFMMFFS